MNASSACFGLQRLLGRIQGQDEWSSADGLGQVPLAAVELDTLIECVRYLHEWGVGKLSPADRMRWGAGMLLVGALALRAAAEGPFTYERVAEHMGMKELVLEPDERNAMEDGARWWCIELLRKRVSSGKVHRQFLGTMIRQSGGGWAILEELARQVSTRWSWVAVAAADLETVAAWIQLCVERRYLTSKRMASALINDEARDAMAVRLRDLAAVWRTMREQVQSDAEDVQATLAELQTSGLADLLDAPDAAAQRRMLELLCELRTTDNSVGEPDWRWYEDAQGRQMVVIELPEQLQVPQVPGTVHQVRVRVVDGEGERSAVYAHARGELRYVSGLRRLLPPRYASSEVAVVAEYGQEGGVGELELARLALPGAEVAMFHRHNRRALRRAQPGTPIVLVPQPGWVLDGLAGFEQGGRAPLNAWLGEMPAEPITCALCGPDGERDEWELGAAGRRLEVELGNRVSGLRLDSAPVVSGPPVLVLRSYRNQRGAYRLLRADGSVVAEGPVLCRGGKVRLPVSESEWRPGRYRIWLRMGNEARTLAVTAVTETVELRAVSDTEGTRVQVNGARKAQLAWGGHDSEGQLVLGPEVRGPVSVDMILDVSEPNQQRPRLLVGTWRGHASPLVAEVVSGQDGEVLADDDIGSLRGTGGLRIYGPPSGLVRVLVGTLRWTLQLSAAGQRFFSLLKIPGPVLAELHDRLLSVVVRWDGGAERSFGFRDYSAEKLTFNWIEPAEEQGERRLFLRWKRPVHGHVHVEAVPAWQPWMLAAELPCTPAQHQGEPGFELSFRLPHGPYQVCLMEGQRRLSGLALVWSNPSDGHMEMPEGLGELERELWQPSPHMGRLAGYLAERTVGDEEELILGGLVRLMGRYGTLWFKSAGAMLNALGTWRLRALADEDWELGELVERYYGEMGVPLMFVLEQDVRRMSKVLGSMRSGTVNRLLESVADLREGLLVLAMRAWGHLVDQQPARGKRRLEAVKSEYTYYQEGPRALRHDELELLRLPAEDMHDDLPLGVCSPRMIGLVQLRGRERDAAYSAAGRRRLERGVRPPQALQESWFRSLPELLQGAEQLLACLAWDVYRWRRAGDRPARWMSELDRVKELAPASFDYWLNVWEMMNALDNR